jgi:hypothetical protein
MCPPVVAAITLVMAVASAVMTYKAQEAQHQTGEQLARNETIRYDRNVIAAQNANKVEHQQLHRREWQERDAAIEKGRVGAVQSQRVIAQQAARYGESGVTGISVDNVLADLERGEASNTVLRETNYMNTVAQLRDEMKAADTRAEARINSMQPGANTTPPANTGQLVVGIGQGVVSAMGAYGKAGGKLS